MNTLQSCSLACRRGGKSKARPFSQLSRPTSTLYRFHPASLTRARFRQLQPFNESRVPHWAFPVSVVAENAALVLRFNDFAARTALVERNALPFRDFHFLPAAALRASQDSSTFSSAGQGSLTSFSPIRAGALSQQLFRAESCPFQASFFPGPPSCCA